MRQISNTDFELLTKALPDVCRFALKYADQKTYNRARRLVILSAKLRRRRRKAREE